MDELQNLSEMILLDAVLVSLIRLKEHIVGDQLEEQTPQRPDIGLEVILKSQKDLRGSVRPCRDFVAEAVMGPASVAEVRQLELKIIVFVKKLQQRVGLPTFLLLLISEANPVVVVLTP